MEKFIITGNVKITHKDKDGNILSIDEGHNLVVNKGLEMVSKLLNGGSVLPFTFLQIGIGTTGAAAANTTLGTPITTPYNMAIKAGTCEYLASYIAKIYTTFTNNGDSSIAVTEAGIFDAITPGNMLCRKVFAAKNVVAAEAILVEWKITVATV